MLHNRLETDINEPQLGIIPAYGSQFLTSIDTFQISGAEYGDQSFLESAVQEYKKYLWLCKKYPVAMVPCIMEDLMWHTHMLMPQYYCPDMIQYCGKRH